MEKEKKLADEIRKIIDYLKETAEEQHAREPSPSGIKTLLEQALKKAENKQIMGGENAR